MDSKCVSTSQGPLEGVRVLDLGTMIAGPVAATLLADFGATVVKVEQPEVGDTLRHIGPFFEGESLYWNVDARNKQSITINLRTPEGQDLVRSLVPHFDVVVENFRPGTLRKWALDYEALSGANPNLIMLSISGFGQTGPNADRAAYDRIAAAFGGLLNITGFPDRPPVRIGVSMADYLTALFGAFSVMMALYRRDMTQGRGQHIDLALYETVFRFTDTMVTAHQKLGTVRERQGNLGFAAAPGDHFLTSDGRYIVLTISNDHMFKRLCTVMDREDLSKQSKYESHEKRWQHINELNDIVASWIVDNKVEYITNELQRAGLAYSLVYSVADIVEDPHYKARNAIETVTTEHLGELMMPGVASRFSETPAGPLRPAPRLGQDTERLLTDLLNLSPDEIMHLRSSGTI